MINARHSYDAISPRRHKMVSTKRKVLFVLSCNILIIYIDYICCSHIMFLIQVTKMGHFICVILLLEESIVLVIFRLLEQCVH